MGEFERPHARLEILAHPRAREDDIGATAAKPAAPEHTAAASARLRAQLDHLLRIRPREGVLFRLRLRVLLRLAGRARRVLDRLPRLELLRGEDAGGPEEAGAPLRVALGASRLLLRREVVLEYARLGARHGRRALFRPFFRDKAQNAPKTRNRHP